MMRKFLLKSASRHAAACVTTCRWCFPEIRQHACGAAVHAHAQDFPSLCSLLGCDTHLGLPLTTEHLVEEWRACCQKGLVQRDPLLPNDKGKVAIHGLALAAAAAHCLHAGTKDDSQTTCKLL